MLQVTLAKNVGPLSIRAEFSVGKNGIVALFGRSGSGKTTIVNMLAGLVTPGSGKIKLNGNWIYNSDLGINCAPQKRRFGYVFQEGRLFPHLSVGSNLNYGLKLLSAAQRKIGFEQVVNLLEIRHLLDRRPARLSGGEKQRVAIGRCLLMSPSLLLMDEPLSSLDESCKAEILPFVSSVARELFIPVVYVSHSLNEIRALTDKIILVENGLTSHLAPVRIRTARSTADHPYSELFGDAATINSSINPLLNLFQHATDFIKTQPSGSSRWKR